MNIMIDSSDSKQNIIDDFEEKFKIALDRLLKIKDITVEVCGDWIWVTGDTKPHAEVLGRKDGGIGCYFSSKKSAWYYRPDTCKSRNRKPCELDKIRELHGSVKWSSNSC